MKLKKTMALLAAMSALVFLVHISLPSWAKGRKPTVKPAPAKTRTKRVTTQMTKRGAAKKFPLLFGNLNDFVAKGLPASAAPPKTSLDAAAIVMAWKISQSDEDSLPFLLTALQTAGFSVIDEKGRVLRKPLGKAQGLGFYDFEAVGALKLGQRGVGISLNKIASLITKDTPQISSEQFQELMLQDLRAQAENTDNESLRFWAHLIIELGRSSSPSVDLMTAKPGNINLSMLQASLWLRRLQGEFYALETKQALISRLQSPSSARSSFAPSLRRKPKSSLLRSVAASCEGNLPCNLTSAEALILDAGAVGLTTWNGWMTGLIGEATDASGYATTLGKVGYGLAGANIILAWGKLVASVTSLKGEIIVDNPPLVRTLNSTPGEKRLMTARLWSEVGRKEILNCLRPLLNMATGLDFNLPTDGPLGNVAVEWHFDGDNEIRVNDNATTRNLQQFVKFQAVTGANVNPQKQVTDNKGISKIYLVGASKIPAVLYQKKPTEVTKKAHVLIGVTFKSAKDFAQNWIDIGGTAAGIATGGPLGVLTAIPEIGQRLPYVAAKAEIPVIDHDECDGRWQGTVTYTEIRTSKTSRMTDPPDPARYFNGGYDSSDSTLTLSGTITVNDKNGKNSLAKASADEITILESSFSGKSYCGKTLKIRGWQSWSAKSIQTRIASGSTEDSTTVYIYLATDYYTISTQPPWVKAAAQTTYSRSLSGGCNPSSESNIVLNEL